MIEVPTGFSLWDYRCTFLSNRDGDSVVLVADQGFGNSKTFQDGLRLKDVYAPELNQVGGAATRDFVNEWFRSREPMSLTDTLWPFLVRTDMTARGRERQTFGRYIGVVWKPGDPVTLNQAVEEFVAEKGYPRGTGVRA